MQTERNTHLEQDWRVIDWMQGDDGISGDSNNDSSHSNVKSFRQNHGEGTGKSSSSSSSTVVPN